MESLHLYIDGHTVLIDDEDYAIISNYEWRVKKNRNTFYVVASCGYMHRVLLNAESSYQVDHKNGDGLDNRRTNLRQATSQQNNRNRGKRTNCTSKYKGVHQNRVGTWEASITVNKRRIYLGSFKSEWEAAQAYNKAADSLFLDFARLNIEA